jgi:hypothetical protein
MDNQIGSLQVLALFADWPKDKEAPALRLFELSRGKWVRLGNSQNPIFESTR